MLEYVLDRNERTLLEKDFYKPLDVLYVAWTIKEACYKANSCGYNPSDYKIKGKSGDVYSIRSNVGIFSAVSKKVSNEYLASIAFKN